MVGFCFVLFFFFKAKQANQALDSLEFFKFL